MISNGKALTFCFNVRFLIISFETTIVSELYNILLQFGSNNIYVW